MTKLFWCDTGSCTGLFNMRWDETAAMRVLEGKLSLPEDAALVRFYGWSPFCISLGHNQRSTDIDYGSCAEAGVDVVRRPTGGRAVYHAEEVTYSVVLRPTKTNASHYAEIHEALRLGLMNLKVRCAFNRSSPDLVLRYKSSESMPCFTAAAKYELEAEGKKIVGSAQRRWKQNGDEVLLQHGSILLSPKHKDLAKFLKVHDEQTRERIRYDLDRKTVSVSELTGAVPDPAAVRDAMLEGFREAWCCERILFDAGSVVVEPQPQFQG
ncbi:MAG: lipoate--protein ligase family protein [Rhizobacter sp.]|nr:lipoate--protein ligase family protein [Chlorobiales bacterium]